MSGDRWACGRVDSMRHRRAAPTVVECDPVASCRRQRREEERKERACSSTRGRTQPKYESARARTSPQATRVSWPDVRARTIPGSKHAPRHGAAKTAASLHTHPASTRESRLHRRVAGRPTLTPVCDSVSDGGVAYARRPRSNARIAARSVGARPRLSAVGARFHENTLSYAQFVRCVSGRPTATSFEHSAQAVRLWGPADEVHFGVPETCSTAEIDPPRKVET